MEITVKHSVKAYLHDNVLSDTPNDYIARVSSESSLSVADVCKSAAMRGHADMPAQTIQHGVELFLREMSYLLCDGFSINTGYFTAAPQVKGVFSSPVETFDANKHALLFQFTQGDLLRQLLPHVKVDILGVAESGAEIVQVTDVRTGSVNDVITPLRNIKIKGSKIKLEGTHAEVGVYFVHEPSGQAIPVDPSDVVINKPSELIVVVPPLIAGTYRLMVKTQYGKNVTLKGLRMATFGMVLSVI